jgi:hypothetical protein
VVEVGGRSAPGAPRRPVERDLPLEVDLLGRAEVHRSRSVHSDPGMPMLVRRSHLRLATLSEDIPRDGPRRRGNVRVGLAHLVGHEVPDAEILGGFENAVGDHPGL